MAKTPKRSSWWLLLVACAAGALAVGALSESIDGLRLGAANGPREQPRPIGQHEVPPGEVTAYNAQWRYRDGDEGRERVREAIELAIREMTPLARELARERLRERLVPGEHHAIEIEIEAETIDFRIDDCPAIEDAPLDEWVEWSCGDDHLRVKHELRREALVQLMEDARSEEPEFHQQRRFLVVDGALNMSLSFEERGLPRAVEFELNYSRQQPPRDAG
jgi:hypothetical protein